MYRVADLAELPGARYHKKRNLIRQCLDLQDRIESMAAYKTPERVMLALVQMAGTLGKSEAATQKLLSRALAALRESYRDDG